MESKIETAQNISDMSDTVILRKMTPDDIPLFEKWLGASHVARWFTEPQDWMHEAREMYGEFGWIHRYIAQLGGRPFGFCQYYAGRDSGEEWLSLLELDGTYCMDYMIGEADCLRRGFGKQMLTLLREEILRNEPVKRLSAQIDPKNAASRGVLLSCGFSEVSAEKGVFAKDPA